MLEEWFPQLELSLSWEEFLALPRHPASRYEYRGGLARITSHPRYLHCWKLIATDNTPPQDLQDWSVRRLQDSDWSSLVHLFERSFAGTVPFVNCPRDVRLAAAETLLDRTRRGADGPLAEDVCTVAMSRTAGKLAGAMLVTRVPSKVFGCDPGEGTFVPHVTWIFVDPGESRRGLGRALLAKSMWQLAEAKQGRLFSTVLLGQQASMLWHWKVGFELLGDPGSPGRISAEKQNGRD